MSKLPDKNLIAENLKAVRDAVLLGTGYVRFTPSDDGIKIERIDPSTIVLTPKQEQEDDTE